MLQEIWDSLFVRESSPHSVIVTLTFAIKSSKLMAMHDFLANDDTYQLTSYQIWLEWVNGSDKIWAHRVPYTWIHIRSMHNWISLLGDSSIIVPPPLAASWTLHYREGVCKQETKYSYINLVALFWHYAVNKKRGWGDINTRLTSVSYLKNILVIVSIIILLLKLWTSCYTLTPKLSSYAILSHEK